MTTQNVKVDSKGRIIVPNSFREALGIKAGGNIEAHLDKGNDRIMLFPIEKATRKLVVLFGDVPGSLAKVAAILARNKVDLVYTSSRSMKRRQEAEWEIIADFSKAELGKLKSDLKEEKSVKSFKFEYFQK